MLSRKDTLGTLGARTGFTRNSYRITPGLYCVGEPDSSSPVIVTANYKLSVDILRKELNNMNGWLLVIDTRGINVWCAAGKGTFSAEEIAFWVQDTKLEQIVNHRELILPQLSANGVAAKDIKKLCGFRGKFGPIKAEDLPRYLRSGKIDEQMRTVTFTLKERAVLIPLEICMLWKQFLGAVLLFFTLSAITPDFFSFAHTLLRTSHLILATLTAMLSGAILTPLLLPWIPFRQFWLKGALMGLIVGGLFIAGFSQEIPLPVSGQIALISWITSCSSFLAMNFTGSTVFTSLSGVAREMRKGLPFQVSTAVIAIFSWLLSGFLQ